HLPYKTAKEHWDALMAQAKRNGGPTQYSRTNMPPDWDGWYQRDNADATSQWMWGTINQVPTILSLLTPEYQKRMVQMNYHAAVDDCAFDVRVLGTARDDRDLRAAPRRAGQLPRPDERDVVL